MLQYSCLENSMNRGSWIYGSMGHRDSDMTEQIHTHTHTHMAMGYIEVFIKSNEYDMIE